MGERREKEREKKMEGRGQNGKLNNKQTNLQRSAMKVMEKTSKYRKRLYAKPLVSFKVLISIETTLPPTKTKHGIQKTQSSQETHLETPQQIITNPHS